MKPRFLFTNCSGLPGRTSLRHNMLTQRLRSRLGLFRSSRPDFIETENDSPEPTESTPDCSGLPGRTSLRLRQSPIVRTLVASDCSGLPGRTSLRHLSPLILLHDVGQLFRFSRPDFIETHVLRGGREAYAPDCSGLPGRTSLRRVHSCQTFSCCLQIVPVFQAGLH